MICPTCLRDHTYAEWHVLGLVCPLCLKHTTTKWRNGGKDCQSTGTRHNYHLICPGAACRLEPERHG